MEKLLVSSCLLGMATRYDGKSKKAISDTDLASLSEKYHIVPFCPEIYGGLPTPRIPSERISDTVKMKDGSDVTENYKKGAREALGLCRAMNIKKALLKEKSPSCAKYEIYDGSFTGTLVNGKGVASELLQNNGIEVFNENEIAELLA